MSEYTHTLIPSRPDYAPEPEQVGAFLDALVKLGSAPLQAKLTVGKLSGEFRSGVNPFTHKTESWPIYDHVKLADVASLTKALKALDDYIIQMAGLGPPRVQPLTFDFRGAYGFCVHCRLHAQSVSTSDWHDNGSLKHKVASFGTSCDSKNRMGIFYHPKTLKLIEVPGAGCARFYIEFEFGKALFPEIADRLDIIEPSILDLARQHFEIEFVQGCHWGT
jgi:hypothetical protein